MKLRIMIACALLTVLSSCRPVYNLSLFNGSGVDLTVNGQNGEIVSWGSEDYLTFDNSQSNMVGMSYPDILFSVSDPEGKRLIYTVNRENSRAFRFVTTGALNETQKPASVTPAPERACIHIRIESDMNMYWMDSGCGRRDLKDTARGEQPTGFPVIPVQQ